MIELATVAARLEGLEETIIFKLVDRAQFALNTCVYEPGKSGFHSAGSSSLFDLRLRFQEEMDARFGRYEVPEERPFSRNLPQPDRCVTQGDAELPVPDYQAVNLTAAILPAYLDLLPRLCQNNDDRQYGSSVEHDVYALQAISRRIHYGALYVAECKYRERPEEYASLCRRHDHDGVRELLTRKEVEERILVRVREKVAWAQEQINRDVRTPVDPDIILRFYRDTIIPLTKDGEIRYLYARVGVPAKEPAVE